MADRKELETEGNLQPTLSPILARFRFYHYCRDGVGGFIGSGGFWSFPLKLQVFFEF
jgi:hypothetical protein